MEYTWKLWLEAKEAKTNKMARVLLNSFENMLPGTWKLTNINRSMNRNSRSPYLNDAPFQERQQINLIGENVIKPGDEWRFVCNVQVYKMKDYYENPPDIDPNNIDTSELDGWGGAKEKFKSAPSWLHDKSQWSGDYQGQYDIESGHPNMVLVCMLSGTLDKDVEIRLDNKYLSGQLTDKEQKLMDTNNPESTRVCRTPYEVVKWVSDFLKTIQSDWDSLNDDDYDHPDNGDDWGGGGGNDDWPNFWDSSPGGAALDREKELAGVP